LALGRKLYASNSSRAAKGNNALMNQTIRVAAVQMEPVVGDLNANTEKIQGLLEQALHRSCRLIVFPELCTSGYVFRDHQEAVSTSLEVKSPFFDSLAQRLQPAEAYAVIGFNEFCANRLYNSAALIGPKGLIGVYRKTHLWYQEKTWFSPGDTGFPVFDTDIGRLAIAICYDLSFPEVFRIYMEKGVQVVAFPTDWVPDPPPFPIYDKLGNSMMNYLAISRCSENAFFMVCADRVGVERGVRFVGASAIIGTRGWPLAGPASGDKEEILCADINPLQSDVNKVLNEMNHIQMDRRIDLYDRMLGLKWVSR
jgi:N-carbamoylputrescine amidase